MVLLKRREKRIKFSNSPGDLKSPSEYESINSIHLMTLFTVLFSHLMNYKLNKIT